jgi:hypothetical protein
MATNNAINLKAQGVAYYNGTGTFSAPTITQFGTVIGAAANDITSLGVATNGQLVIGSTGTTPVLGTLTPGTGVTITNGAGSITIAATGGGLAWVDQTTSSVTMAINTGYLVDAGASLITLTLPLTAPQFSVIEVRGYASGGWTIAQNATQQIIFSSSSTTAGTGGSISSTQAGDGIRLIAAVGGTATIWTAEFAIGNLTIV